MDINLVTIKQETISIKTAHQLHIYRKLIVITDTFFDECNLLETLQEQEMPVWTGQ